MANTKNNIVVKAIKVEQNNKSFFLCKLNKDTLIKISTTSMGNMGTEKEIYQRNLDGSRASKIGKFIERNNSILPTAIILNSRQSVSYNEADTTINLSLEPDSCFIVDGQHRIEGARLAKNDFEFVVVVLEMLDTSEQTEIFVTINNEQKRVNPSVRFNLYANDKEKTPERVVRRIAYLLNVDENSPFYGRIKMDDTKSRLLNASISLSAFSIPIVEFIYTGSDYFELKDSLKNNECFISINESFRINHKQDYKDKLLWEFYIWNEEMFIHKIIFNFFAAVKDIFTTQWMDKKSIVYKTTGYNALILVLKELLKEGKENRNFAYEFFYQRLLKAKKLSEKLYVEYYGIGKIASYRLFNDIINNIGETKNYPLSDLSFLVDED